MRFLPTERIDKSIPAVLKEGGRCAFFALFAKTKAKIGQNEVPLWGKCPSGKSRRRGRLIRKETTDGIMELFISILAEILFLILYGTVSGCEATLFTASESKLENALADGKRGAKRVLAMREHQGRWTVTLEILSAVSLMAISALLCLNLSPRLSQALLSGLSLPAEVMPVVNGFSVALVLLLSVAVSVLFGSVLAKRIALRDPEKAAMHTAGAVFLLSLPLRPLIFAIRGIANLFLRMGGSAERVEEDTVSEDEIRTLVDRGTEKGILDDEEGEIIQNVFEFGDLAVGKLALHRTEVEMLSAEEPLEAWEALLRETNHTIYPVCGESVDEILGVLDTRDFFRNRHLTKEELLKTVVKPAYFVPETAKADIIFKEMKKTGNYFAVVVDEYGGILGIVTLYDLISQLVGDIETEETAAEEPDIQPLEEGVYRIRGSVLLEELNEQLKWNLPTDEYDTFGGYVFGLYGSVPEDGSQITVENDRLTITSEEISEHKLLFAKVAEKEEAEAEE